MAQVLGSSLYMYICKENTICYTCAPQWVSLMRLIPKTDLIAHEVTHNIKYVAVDGIKVVLCIEIIIKIYCSFPPNIFDEKLLTKLYENM